MADSFQWLQAFFEGSRRRESFFAENLFPFGKKSRDGGVRQMTDSKEGNEEKKRIGTAAEEPRRVIKPVNVIMCLSFTEINIKCHYNIKFHCG